MHATNVRPLHSRASCAPVWSPATPDSRRDRERPRERAEGACIARLGLAVGDPLRLFPEGGVEFSFEARLVGWIIGKLLLVSVPAQAPPGLARPGQHCRLRAFAGRTAVSFATTVLAARVEPVSCLDLAFPAQVHVCEVRGEERIATDIPVRARGPGALPVRDCRLADVSLGGIRLHAPEPVAAPGARVLVDADIDVGCGPRHLALEGVVRNLAARAASGGGWDHGIELDGPPPIEHRRLHHFLRH